MIFTKNHILSHVRYFFGDIMFSNKFEQHQSPLFANIKALGRILESPDHHVWCASPIWDNEGRVHVFFSRWSRRASHYAWVMSCEVAHAVADRPEGPYTVLDVALKGRGGDAWDGWSIHNPTIHKVGDKYALFYMGSNGSDFDLSCEELEDLSRRDGAAFAPYFKRLVKSKRVGLAVSDSLNGPWKRVSVETPLIDVGPEDAWDDYCTTNPAFVRGLDGKMHLFYKSWRGAKKLKAYLSVVESSGRPDSEDNFAFNRQYGLTVADKLCGPYTKVGNGPIIDLSYMGNNAQCEDAYLFTMNGEYHMVMRDMGYFHHDVGLHFRSPDGRQWGKPQVAFGPLQQYLPEPIQGLDREGRLERPQILMSRDGSRPAYLFGAAVGGRHGLSSAVVLKI